MSDVKACFHLAYSLFYVLEHQEELRKVRDVRNRRLEALRQENKSCYDVVQWLHNHQDLFQYPIIEPLILVVNFLVLLTVKLYSKILLSCEYNEPHAKTIVNSQLLFIRIYRYLYEIFLKFVPQNLRL